MTSQVYHQHALPFAAQPRPNDRTSTHHEPKETNHAHDRHAPSARPCPPVRALPETTLTYPHVESATAIGPAHADPSPEGVRALLDSIRRRSTAGLRFHGRHLFRLITGLPMLGRAYREVVRRTGRSPVGRSGDAAEYLETLHRELRQHRYRQSPYRECHIRQANKRRRLRVPSLQDRIVHQAILPVLTAVFDPHLSEVSWGFRPQRSVVRAMHSLDEWVFTYHPDPLAHYVIRTDIADFFDHVGQNRVRSWVADRIADKGVLRLIRQYLRTQVETRGRIRSIGRGVPQGGALSPILANLVADDIDRTVYALPQVRWYARYGDDIIIVARGQEATAREVLTQLDRQLQNQGLARNVRKTHLCVLNEDTDWLGYRLRVREHLEIGIAPYVIPRIVAKVQGRIHRLGDSDQLVRDLDRRLRGWLRHYGWYRTAWPFREELLTALTTTLKQVRGQVGQSLRECLAETYRDTDPITGAVTGACGHRRRRRR